MILYPYCPKCESYHHVQIKTYARDWICKIDGCQNGAVHEICNVMMCEKHIIQFQDSINQLIESAVTGEIES